MKHHQAAKHVDLTGTSQRQPEAISGERSGGFRRLCFADAAQNLYANLPKNGATVILLKFDKGRHSPMVVVGLTWFNS